jgi:hypothetical protein
MALGMQSRLAARGWDVSRRKKPLPTSRALSRRVMELGTAVIVVIGAMFVLVPAGVGEGVTRNLEKRFPVAAMGVLRNANPQARVLADYGWGGYVIHELYATGGRVFVDGRNDMYDQHILEDYDSIREAEPNWRQLAASYGVNAIMVKPDAAITKGPAKDAGWCQAFRDDTQVLYLPTCP